MREGKKGRGLSIESVVRGLRDWGKNGGGECGKCKRRESGVSERGEWEVRGWERMRR